MEPNIQAILLTYTAVIGAKCRTMKKMLLVQVLRTC